ncbi:cysteine desulfurase-like protein [Occallatibacter riparius]|uniref:Cysteine desulfurase-like protein n=1 Tax=Occallatibacter riparius TaxID=1002689 RepID=A0A9J7BRG4_9BACT|nr:cysteine desulfurase-like protein [Occallatibacter riparius]UWZ85167.1 cysteine desulfurase-like protein [Occallatibacter riparius]
MSAGELGLGATLDIEWVRSQFPSLETQVNGQPVVFMDGPAGTQVPMQVIGAIQDYLINSNANTGGAFLTSCHSDEMIANTRAAMADFFHCDPCEVVFGQNMTTLTFAMSRAIGRELQPGDEILLTTLDHDANFSPWKALEERGVVIQVAGIREEDCTLDLDDLKRKLSRRTKLVAVGYASNAVGTINPVREITRLAHSAGAMTFIDAVHYAPHGLIDVKGLDCDFLVCSPYKFFGPHMGVLFGKREHLDRVQPYRVRPSHDEAPDRWETGTLAHELIAGIGVAVEYIAGLGRHCNPGATTRREALEAAYRNTVSYERSLITRLIDGLLTIPSLRIYGITDPKRFDERCSTLSLRIGDHSPKAIAEFLANRGIFTWDGNYYALNLMERLGVEQKGGMLRIGLVHYNTFEEVERLLDALRALTS